MPNSWSSIARWIAKMSNVKLLRDQFVLFEVCGQTFAILHAHHAGVQIRKVSIKFSKRDIWPGISLMAYTCPPKLLLANFRANSDDHWIKWRGPHRLDDVRPTGICPGSAGLHTQRLTIPQAIWHSHESVRYNVVHCSYAGPKSPGPSCQTRKTSKLLPVATS